MENRIIKFRAWDGDKIIYQSEDGWFDKVKHPEYQSPQCMQFTSVMRVCKIMQFTGLADKNGVEIYEGDVVRNWQGGWNVVVYKAPGFEATVSENESSLYTEEWWRSSEVIGNIYENPELLNP